MKSESRNPRRVLAPPRRRGTVLLMIVGLLAMLFMIVTAYITLARFDRITLTQAGASAQVEQVLGSINDVLAAQIASSWTDPNTGRLEFGGARYADIPGVGADTWLASNAPVRDPASSATVPQPGDYVYPAVTSVGPGKALGKRVTELMFDRSDDTDGGSGNVYVEPGNTTGGANDTLYNARRSFMDADGDGIADSFFGDPSHAGGTALLTELANVMAGRSARTTGVNPSSIPDSDSYPDSPLVKAWAHFDQEARYIPSARVVSHGGMVSLALPRDPNAPARRVYSQTFQELMYRWVQHRSDTAPLSAVDAEALLNLWNERASIEPLLRLRGGLLVGERGTVTANLPSALADVMKRYRTTFENTLLPWSYARTEVMGNSGDETIKLWQRFNLASAEDWQAWRHAIGVDADALLNSASGSGQADGVARRQYLTLTNYSDDVARDQTDNLPGWDVVRQEWSTPGLWPGQPKYYLGQIANAFDPGTKEFLGDTGEPGQRIVGELADYYNEMLYDYKWKGDESSKEIVRRSEQAYMLAVNTVAFAAPRDPNLNIDTVYYDAVDVAGGMTRYCGVGPQLYFTEAMAYNDPNTLAEVKQRIALGVELYYPEEPGTTAQSWTSRLSVGKPDAFALNLSKFAISVNDADPNDGTKLVRLSTVVGAGQYLSGRSFLTLSINDQGSNTAFDNNPPPDGVIGTLPVKVRTDNVGEQRKPARIEIKLWKFNNAETMKVLVDEIVIVLGGSEPDPAGQWFAEVHRDTRGTDPAGGSSYYGLGPGGTSDREARWRMVANTTNMDPNEPNAPGPVTGMEAGVMKDRVLPLLFTPEVWIGGLNGTNDYDALVDNPAPLYTMNAGAAASTLFLGERRPASFPTVGFLLFVPRYSHISEPGAGARPMSDLLAEDWTNKKVPGLPYDFPADFGHMPVFDNRQDVRSTSDFRDSETGRVPWGLMVFDYFTTIDPRGPDHTANTGDEVDPYRIAGRININTASWYVLAGLPLIGPGSTSTTANLPVSQGGSPAFWSAQSGVLAGVGVDNNVRYLGQQDLNWRPYKDPGYTNVWRLGEGLGQAAAAYRDRVPYIETFQGSTVSPMVHAWLRNIPLLPGARRYRPTAYGENQDEPASSGGVRASPIYIVAGDPALDPSFDPKRGFLTIGELANVAGFDSSNDVELNLDPNGAYTVLGKGDFMKAVSLLALLDSNFLTTRSNVFTIYTTLAVHDPDDSQSSVRSQMTVDRTNLLPRLVMQDRYPTNGDGIAETPLLQDTDGDGRPDTPVILRGSGQPEVIARRQIEYFNARNED